MAQLALGAVGAAAGWFAGNTATAAMIGFSIGMALGTPAMQVPGNRLGEISKQTAKEGDPRTIVWGTVRPIGGNVIASQDPPRIVRKKKKSGKGGGSETTEENVYRTYAIGVCEGPITAFLRIWRNNKLVYDGRPGSTWGAKNNATFLKKARLYLGGYDQLPDSALEAVWGVGNVPGHRGTAYMVMDNEKLTDMGGAIPQWTFEVARAEGYYLTSRPYPVLMPPEGVDASAGMPEVRLQDTLYAPPAEGVNASATITEIEIKDLYRQQPPEGADASAAITDVYLREALYQAPAEGADASAAVTDVQLYESLYQSPPEGADASAAITEVLLTDV